jgi:hypothetical protein
MKKDLTSRLHEIDNRLNALKPGEVLDISSLNEEEVKVITQYYSKDYFMRGPLEDKDNKGKYVLALMVDYREEGHS